MSAAPADSVTTAREMVSCPAWVDAVLGLAVWSTSVMVISLSTTATSLPRGRKVVLKALPVAVDELLASRSSVGASLTAVTLTVAVSLPVENAVLPPRAPGFTLLPCVPVAWSQA